MLHPNQRRRKSTAFNGVSNAFAVRALQNPYLYKSVHIILNRIAGERLPFQAAASYSAVSGKAERAGALYSGFW